MRAAVIIYTFKDGKEWHDVHTFESPMAALQWVDRTNPKGSESSERTRVTASGLLEGRETSVYYRGCDVTTNLTENK